MTTTPSNPKHVVDAGPGDYDAFLHGQYIGSFRSEMEAWTELNQVRAACAAMLYRRCKR